MEQLIPREWFVGLPWWGLLLITVFGFAALIRGADWLVEGASGLAYRFGIAKVIVGATIVSLGTTSPEAAVSVMAAWAGDPGLALGNAVGSIIADTGLIFGLGCLLAVLPADRFVLVRQGWVQFGSGMILAVLCFALWIQSGSDAVIGRLVGVAFLVLLCLYLYMSIRWSRAHPEGEPFQSPEDFPEAEGIVPHHQHPIRGVGLLVLMVVGGLVIVIASSQVLVNTAREVALLWGVPQVVVASTIVALGTSLPELVVGISAIRQGHAELLVGNIIGADILNVLFVVGASAAAAPLPIVDAAAAMPAIFLYLHLPTMILILFLFRIFAITSVERGSFRRWHGAPLLATYVVFVVLQYTLG